MTVGIPTRYHSFSNNFPKLSMPVSQGAAGMFRFGGRGRPDNQEAQGYRRKDTTFCEPIETRWIDRRNQTPKRY